MIEAELHIFIRRSKCSSRFLFSISVFRYPGTGFAGACERNSLLRIRLVRPPAVWISVSVSDACHSVTQLAQLARLTRLTRLGRLARPSLGPRLVRLGRLGRLGRLARLAWLAWLGWVGSVGSVASLGSVGSVGPAE